MALKLEEKEETIVHNVLNLTSLLLINCSLHTSEFSRRLTYLLEFRLKASDQNATLPGLWV